MLELKNSKTTFLGKAPNGRNRFALDCHIGAIQMREASGEWQDINPTVEELDADGSTINFTKTPMFVKVGEDGKRRIYPDKTDLSYWVEFQKPFASMGKPVRKGRWFYWNFTHAIIGILVTNTGVKFGFRLKDNQAPTSITIPFVTQGITRQGRLLYHDGKVVAELRKPIATGSNLDADGEPVQKECNIAFAAGQVTISLEPSGLEYPIDIDPTLEVQVGAGLDDGFELESSGAMYTANTVIALHSSSSATRYWGGFRFVSGEFPSQGATITVAYLRVYIGSTSYDDANFNIHLEELAAPAALTTDNFNITTRDRTEFSVSWVASSIGTGWKNSPSLLTGSPNSPIEELWAAYSPSTIVVITRPNTDTTKEFTVRAWEETTAPTHTWGAILHLEYTLPPAGRSHGYIIF